MTIKHYSDLLAQNAIEIAKAKRMARWLVAVKLISFVFVVVSVYLWTTSTGMYHPIAFFVLLGGYILAYRLGMEYDNRVEFYQVVERCYRQEIAYLNRDFSSFGCGERFIDPSHEFSFDLDLFGQESFFHRINRTVSSLGAHTLAQMLTSLPDNPCTVLRRQESISELENKETFRIHFRALGQGSSIDTTRAIEALQADKLPNPANRPAIHWLMCLSVGTTLLLITLTLLSLLPPALAGTAFVCQLFVYLLFAKQLYSTTEKITGLHKSFHRSWKLLKLIGNEPFTSPMNRELQAELTAEQPNAVTALYELARLLSRLDSRNNALGMILFNGLFLRDLFLIRQYNRWKTTYANHLPGWLDRLAQMDALVSLSTYQFNHPENTLPTVDPNPHTVFEASSIYHPFLPQEKAVGNDFTLCSTDLAIVTGANMAGKSTFLRTLGINYVMALCGLKVCAVRLRIPLLKLFTGMRTSDNLNKNISYFHAELLRLEQLIAFCYNHTHTLIILDEILKGTNSEDKLKGSRLFLTEIARMDLRAVIATHDLELSKLEEEDKRFGNYCFEIPLNEEASYSYKLTRGVARNMNATYLLRRILTGKNNKQEAKNLNTEPSV